MANIVFNNNTSGLNELFYDSHAQLLRMVALELGAEDKLEYLQEKFLGKKLKIKKQKNHAPKKAKTFISSSVNIEENLLKNIRNNKGKQDKNMMGNVAKKLGEMWKKCKDKSKYVTMANKDKERYENEMNAFNEKYG